MPHSVIIRRATRAIVVIDPPVVNGHVTLPGDDDYDLVQITDAEAAKFSQAGVTFSLDVSNAVTTAPPAPSPDPTPEEAERIGARTDIQSAYAVMDARLADIVTNGGAYTAAEVRAAVHDLAVIVRRLGRYLKTVTG